MCDECWELRNIGTEFRKINEELALKMENANIIANAIARLNSVGAPHPHSWERLPEEVMEIEQRKWGGIVPSHEAALHTTACHINGIMFDGRKRYVEYAKVRDQVSAMMGGLEKIWPPQYSVSIRHTDDEMVPAFIPTKEGRYPVFGFRVWAPMWIREMYAAFLHFSYKGSDHMDTRSPGLFSSAYPNRWHPGENECDISYNPFGGRSPGFHAWTKGLEWAACSAAVWQKHYDKGNQPWVIGATLHYGHVRRHGNTGVRSDKARILALYDNPEDTDESKMRLRDIAEAYNVPLLDKRGVEMVAREVGTNFEEQE